jgi:hypothetical protein
LQACNPQANVPLWPLALLPMLALLPRMLQQMPALLLTTKLLKEPMPLAQKHKNLVLLLARRHWNLDLLLATELPMPDKLLAWPFIARDPLLLMLHMKRSCKLAIPPGRLFIIPGVPPLRQ